MTSSSTLPAVTPYLCARGAAQAIEFYKQVFGAIETGRIDEPDGRIGHAEIRVGGAPIFIADEFPEIGVLSPHSLGGSPVTIHLMVEDVDAVAERAAAAGATLLRPVADQDYGHRNAKLADPFGHIWMISTLLEAEQEEEQTAGPVREGFHTVTAYLIAPNVDELIAFMSRAFGAAETFRATGSAGGTHAEVRIGDSMVMIGGGAGSAAPMPAMIHLYMRDVDGAYARAIEAGATSIAGPADFPDGDRRAGVRDRFGNQWWIGAPRQR
jgi:PhnB protein